MYVEQNPYILYNPRYYGIIDIRILYILSILSIYYLIYSYYIDLMGFFHPASPCSQPSNTEDLRGATAPAAQPRVLAPLRPRGGPGGGQGGAAGGWDEKGTGMVGIYGILIG